MLINLYIQEAIKRAFVVAVVYCVIRACYLLIAKKKPILKREVLFCVTLTYLIILLDYTVMPNIRFGFESNGKFYFYIRTWKSGGVNLIPFKTIGMFLFQSDNPEVSGWREVSALNLAANVGLFIPYGILMWFYPWCRHSVKRIVCTGALLSVFIEIMQIFVQRGTDIDDVILNTLGVWIGSAVMAVVWKGDKKGKIKE